MKKIGVIIFLLCSLAVFSQVKKPHELLLKWDRIDSLPNPVDTLWKFTEGDDSSMALPSYNDSAWKEGTTSLRLAEGTKKFFNDIRWFRLHFIADTTVAGKP